MKNFIVCAVACLAVAGACCAESHTTKDFLQTLDVPSCTDSFHKIATDVRIFVFLNQRAIEVFVGIIQEYIKCIPQEGIGACNSWIVPELKERRDEFLRVIQEQVQKIVDDVREGMRNCIGNI